MTAALSGSARLVALGAALLLAFSLVPVRAASADTRTVVTVSIGGSVIVGGAYLAWRIAVSRRVSEGGSPDEESRESAALSGVGEAGGAPRLRMPDLHVPVFTMRF